MGSSESKDASDQNSVTRAGPSRQDLREESLTRKPTSQKSPRKEKSNQRKTDQGRVSLKNTSLEELNPENGKENDDKLPRIHGFSEPKYEDSYARLIWAAHILSYMPAGRSQPELLLQIDHELSEQSENEDLDDGLEIDSNTIKNDILSGSDEVIRQKFLDCLAENISRSKGWHYVTAAIMREQEDSADIYVARNGGFDIEGIFGRLQGVNQGEDEQYFGKFEAYMATQIPAKLQVVGGNEDCELHLFESLTIKYNSNRIDNWIRLFKSIASEMNLNRNVLTPAREFSERLLSNEVVWWSFEELEARVRQWTEDDESRDRIVQQAYRCTTFRELPILLQSYLGNSKGAKLHRTIRLLARPVTNCRILARIAAELPQFRNLTVWSVPPPPTRSLHQRHIVSINDAWQSIFSAHFPHEPRDLHAFIKKNRDFQKDCSREFTTHAEIQLSLSQAQLKPTLNYIGCSKKSCLLCEAFLRIASPPMSVRGRHGTCYPAWGIPSLSHPQLSHCISKLENLVFHRILEKVQGSAKIQKNQIAQSTIVSDLGGVDLKDIWDRKKTLEAKEKETEHRNELRRLLENPLSLGRSTAVDASADSCLICKESGAKYCQRCRSCRYCSRECQLADWPSHKLLCMKYRDQGRRPSSSHKRAILFPVDTERPCMIWVDKNLPMGKAIQGFLGQDHPDADKQKIGHNPRRDLNLGYNIVVYFRDNFTKDGSESNNSILKTVGLKETVPYDWRGPIVVLKEVLSVEDITLADFRHILDYFAIYGNSMVGIPQSMANSTKEHGPVMGVQINCYGEMLLHGAQQFTAVSVPKYHPSRRYMHPEGDISPVSRLVRIAMRVWRLPDVSQWFNLPNWEENIGPDTNQAATFLMLECDISKDLFGWAPFHWQLEVGNVLVVSTNDEDLTVEQVRLLCYFCQRKLQPRFEDEHGGGYVKRSRQEVFDFITRENMDRCRKELDKIGSTDAI